MSENRIFPENWKEIVSTKKVILYNTSVSSMLHGREKHIKKMKWVFHTFQQHPEIVLWWRPHPLELSTIESMTPNLAEEYVEMRKEYKDKKIGILDESADLHRAVAISDAYYGDWSSVAQLYKAVGKPVLYADDAITRETPTAFLPITFCVKEEGIWFIQCNSNKLIMVDKITYNVEKIITIPFERPFCGREYNYHIVDIGKSLLLCMGKSRRLYEYEVETDTITERRLPIEHFVFDSKIVIEQNYKLLFSYKNHMLMEYDYLNHTVNIREFGRINSSVSQCYEKNGTKFWLTDKESNVICQYDFTNVSYSAIPVGDHSSKYWGVKKVGNCFVLPHIEKKAITIWNEETGEIAELTDFPEEYTYLEGMAYLDMFEKDGYIYFFPFYANMILKVDIEKKTITQAFENIFSNIRYDSDIEESDGRMYICAKQYQNYIYAYAIYKTCWQVFNFSTMDVYESPAFEIRKTEHKDMIECILDNGVYDESFCEGEWVTICCLDNYIKNLHDNNIGDARKNADRESVGLHIHKMIVSEL